MSWNNKVIWSEGLFLQPQHFQQQERYLENQMRESFARSGRFYWGFRTLRLDKALLASGRIGILEASGFFPDGTPFSIPDQDPAPPSFEVPADARSVEVCLAVSSERVNGLLAKRRSSQNGVLDARFQVNEVSIQDVTDESVNESPIETGALVSRVRLSSENNEGLEILPMIRVLERKLNGQLILDEHYAPPCVKIDFDERLMDVVRSIDGILSHRGEALASRMTEPGRGGMSEIADYLMLQVINRYRTVFKHIHVHADVHPETLLYWVLQLAGDSAIFTKSRQPSVFPPYIHDDPMPTFDTLLSMIRNGLSTVLEEIAVRIPLEERKNAVRLGIINDLNLIRSASFVLAASAQIPEELLRQRLPQQIKIGPAEKLRDLVTQNLPGIPIRALPVAPREIPFHAGFNYFRLDTSGNPLWKHLEGSGGLAIHIAGEIPGVELELWAIRG